MSPNPTFSENSINNSKIPVPKSLDKSRLPSAKRGSVFDRLYKTQTIASRGKKPLRDANRIVTRSSPSTEIRYSKNLSRKSTKISKSSDGGVFNRLYVNGTASSSSKRSCAATKSPSKN